MRKLTLIAVAAVLLCACSGKKTSSKGTDGLAPEDSVTEIAVKYATGFSVRDSADIRLVDVGKNDHFALVHSDRASVPDGYTKVRVPIKNTICMTSLQLSNFTILD
ncbi:MAG: iron ABC transporter substrate-binding protein, partial [Prevotella sp.]|nr:iron ABC transporter substrate-binding protein [Prevotella sp.]